MNSTATRVTEQTVRVEVPGLVLEGILAVPEDANGVVLFAHGSGSGRHNPRNLFVAEQLQSAGLATLLIDLLTADEERIDERTRRIRFDIDLLADRLCGAIEWLAAHPRTHGLRVGLFGASTGGGAAAVAAAHEPGKVGAVVSRGGRPDLAGAALFAVLCPTLLIVGGDDEMIEELNRAALAQIGAPVKELIVVPGASHLFEEPGKLDEVAHLAAGWFVRHLGTGGGTYAG
ncbi:family transcriptional regulator : DeoR family transcriptional regulator OS=Mesorhizobium sp. LNHC252B00 GN=X743_07280 PE=4 SV=1: Abhydrolase_5 [Gemmata massiliana]|uniref:Dienelactone hydrolase domain-containing protein n=1 Tax=Gemmata massiliana TaxID=1210884 RepID=A0A6P2CVQ2_9BACT|nr:alpha/beta family hydrolase [Gemmata massiliana]VTR92983.1 family transcriptional regulator : DeoR family transcriptional regulator OS=Mesorhizobium sp. LNHC252B00 GN=X743_07280 PE=4 SV=1: Abhydrolase_5 [Gemmata massiliana]